MVIVMKDQELIQKIARTLYNHKAGEISALKVGHLTVICDYMIIASGRTAAQVSALAEDLDEMMAQEGFELRRSEGAREGRWIVLDYGFILIHLFHRDERAYYHLDRLWDDGTNRIELPFDQTVSD
jgi:ribosome-associated protein